MTALDIAHGPNMPTVEHRGAGDYTDAVLSSFFGAATGHVLAAATAGVQAAAGIVGRALASATIDGDGGAVDPHLLEGIGTDLVRSGRFLGRLTVGADGRARILRAGAVASVVYGDADPESWRYSLQMPGPSSARTVWAEAAEVVNVRINSDSYRPWEGIAPLSRAAASGELYAKLSESLRDEASVAVVRLIPQPQGSTLLFDNMRAALTGHLPGRVAFPETTAAGGGAGRSSAPLRDWAATRLGYEADTPAGTLYAHLFSECAECCGVPSALVNPSSAGPAAREAWRRLTVGTLEPYARLIEAELSRVLETGVVLKLRRLGGVDAAGRARALHVLTEAGFDKDEAADLLGWD